jgi:recombination associated protein RdgC
MFKNAFLYHVARWKPPAAARLEEQLESGRFVPCAATQAESAGWVEPRGEAHAPLVERIAGHLLLELQHEARVLPASVLRQQLEERLDRIESDSGHRPKGKAARDLKDELLLELLPRAFTKRSSVRLWLAPGLELLVVGAANAKRADLVVTRLLDATGKALAIEPLQTALSPARAMTDWLAEREAPAGFTLDRECELRQPDGERATVRYARHTLDIDEVGEHLRQGKRPTRLALTWNDRVSFVLTETLALKRIKLLDGTLEGAGSVAGGDAAGFDADAAIATGELGLMLPALLQALGGLGEGTDEPG